MEDLKTDDIVSAIKELENEKIRFSNLYIKTRQNIDSIHRILQARINLYNKTNTDKDDYEFHNAIFNELNMVMEYVELVRGGNKDE